QQISFGRGRPIRKPDLTSPGTDVKVVRTTDSVGGPEGLHWSGVRALEVGRAIDIPLAVLDVRHPDIAVYGARAPVVDEEASILAGAPGRGGDPPQVDRVSEIGRVPHRDLPESSGVVPPRARVEPARRWLNHVGMRQLLDDGVRTRVEH